MGEDKKSVTTVHCIRGTTGFEVELLGYAMTSGGKVVVAGHGTKIEVNFNQHPQRSLLVWSPSLTSDS